MTIRVLIVDDHAVLRKGLRMLLDSQPDMTVVGEAGTSAAVLESARAAQADVITLDLTLPDGSGLAVLETLRRECPGSLILVLTMHDDPAYLKAVIAAGGSGYVVKTADESEVLAAIRAISQGRAYFSLSMNDALAQNLLGGEASQAAESPCIDSEELSDRQREILTLVAQGFTNQQIADQLYLSVKTIETYRSRLMAKLGLKDRAQLVQYALNTGLLNSSAAAPIIA